MLYGLEWLDCVRGIRVHQQGDRRAPHKPLLMLIAVARLLQGQRELSFTEEEAKLLPLFGGLRTALDEFEQAMGLRRVKDNLRPSDCS